LGEVIEKRPNIKFGQNKKKRRKSPFEKIKQVWAFDLNPSIGFQAPFKETECEPSY
jgi:hypothetical protein